MRASLKKCLELLLASEPAVALHQQRARGRAVVLAYHNVLPDDEPVTGETPLHLRESEFREQLDLLMEFADVVPLAQILESPPNRAQHRLRAAITFDDAYVGTLHVGIPELLKRGLPATLFVPPGLLGSPAFWWDALAAQGPECHRECLERFQGRGDLVLDWARQNAMEIQEQEAHQRPSTVEELVEAADQSSAEMISFGPHTLHHPNLTGLTDKEIEAEVSGSMKWLEREGLPTINWFAFPYGLSSPTVEEACRRSGVGAALVVCGGWVPTGHIDRFHVPRVPIPRGLSPENFLLRLFGVIEC